jgi:hypothetical protein
VIGRAAISRETSSPALGALPAPPNRLLPTADVSAVAARLGMAAAAAGVDRVELIGLDQRQDLSVVAALLRTSQQIASAPAWASVPAAVGEASGTPGWIQSSPSTDPTLVVDPRDQSIASGNGHVRTGLALIGPETAKKRDLDAVGDLVSITGLPLLGIVVYRPRRAFSKKRSTPMVGAARLAETMEGLR